MAEAVGGVGAPDLLQGPPVDGAGEVGHPVEGLVVEGEQDAVARQLGVGFQVEIAEIHRDLERGHGVLGVLQGAAPVGKGERAARRQIGPIGGDHGAEGTTGP
jgi:hypothetical protein